MHTQHLQLVADHTTDRQVGGGRREQPDLHVPTERAQAEDRVVGGLRVAEAIHRHVCTTGEPLDGVADVARTVVGSIDHFDIALNADLSKATAEQIVSGVRVIREELLKTLAQHGVGLINPVQGELFQPGRHEAVMQMAQDGIDSGHIVQTFQAGYTLGADRVLRPAKVAVAP